MTVLLYPGNRKHVGSAWRLCCCEASRRQGACDRSCPLSLHMWCTATMMSCDAEVMQSHSQVMLWQCAQAYGAM